MSDKQENFKELVLQKRDEDKVVFLQFDGDSYAVFSAPVAEFIEQPVDGLLYDLNRLEEIALTFMSDQPKWVNDFAVALTIRALYAKRAALEARLSKMEEDIRPIIEADYTGQGSAQEYDALIEMIQEELAEALTDE